MSFLFELVYFRTIDKQVLISMPFVGTDVYEMCFIMWDLKKKTFMIFSEVNLNMAVKTLAIR